jgi:hypothetical protein
MTMVSAHQGNEPLTALNKIGLNSTVIWMVLERKSRECSDGLCPAELCNTKLDGGFTKYFTIKVKISALETVVLPFVFQSLFLTEITHDASRFVSAETFCVYNCVRPEKGPELLRRSFF